MFNNYWEKKKIKDLFGKNQSVDIIYIWDDKCPVCGLRHRYVDEEYSFKGYKFEFEKHMRCYAALDLESDIMYNKLDDIAYHIESDDNGRICPICEKYVAN